MKQPKKSYVAVFFLTVAVFALSLQSAPQDGYPVKPDFIEAGLKDLATSRVSMVTTAHPFATEVGLRMLRRGGNAMDAAIAATMVVAVLDTGLTSLAGGGQLTYFDAKSQKTVVLNFEPNAFKEDVKPYNRERDGRTGRSIRVPGSIAGFFYAVQKYGKLPWKQIVEPSVFYAENGFPLHGAAYSIIRSHYDTLTLLPTGRDMFAPKGFLPAVGTLFKQAEMADTLKKVAEQGPDYFYRGPLAEQMVKAIREIGGKATLEDFASYRVLELEPIRGTYQGYQLVGPPPPATGIVAIIEGLNILENVNLKAMGHYAESADSLQWVAETLRVMFTDARKYTGIPEFDQAMAKILTSKEYARRQYELIRHRIEQMKRQTGERGAAQLLLLRDVSEDPILGTNHISVVDKEGNVCSFTHTIYGSVYSTSGLFVGGIVMNAAGGFPAQPGERIITPMAPLIVFKGDKPYFATGSSGGTLNTFFTTLNVLAWDKNLKEAQEAPRFRLPTTSFQAPAGDDSKLFIEHRIGEKVAEDLKRRGYQIEWLGPYSMANAQMAGIDPDTGVRHGAADPRAVGHAAGQ